MKIYKVKVNGKVYEVEVEAVDEVSGSIATEAKAPATTNSKAAEGDKVITAPITGKVLEVKVKPGDIVKKGQTVVIIEAMKLENEVQSAFEGRVAEVRTSAGADVKNKEALIVLE